MVASLQQQAQPPQSQQQRNYVQLYVWGGWGRGMVASLQQQAQPPQSQQQHNHVELYVAGGRDVKLLIA